MKKSEKSKANYNQAKAELDSVLETMMAQTRRADFGEKISEHEAEETFRSFISKFTAYLDEAKKL